MAAPDMTQITAAVDFDTVVAAVLAVMVAWLYVQVVVFGVRVVLRAVRAIDSGGHWTDGFSTDDSYSERYSGEGYTDSSGNWIKDDPLSGIDDDIRRASK